MRLKTFMLSVGLLLTSAYNLQAQNTNAELQAYKDFLNSHQNMSAEALEAMNPAGNFNEKISSSPADALYLDSLIQKYSLTDYEKELIQKNGFMVSNRLSFNSFMDALSSVFYYDMPLFISTDAILHSIHMSYDMMLMSYEMNYHAPNLVRFTDALKDQLSLLDKKYSAIPALKTSLKDMDVFITIPQKIFDKSKQPFYSDNTGIIDSIITCIENYTPVDMPLFSKTNRTMDFSQFKPRGHYTNELFPIFQNYFKAMMWFSKADLWLSAPRAIFPAPATENLQRQSVLALLLAEAVKPTETHLLYSGIDIFLEKFVGKCDNVTLDNLNDLSLSAGITSPEMLLDAAQFARFQDTLKSKSYAYQKIMSQILLTGINSADSLIPPSAFAMFGQRFLPDSYITGGLVFDKIKYLGDRPKRMLPKPLDILYALGNDPASRLLKDDIDQYHYASNLAALRYVMDNYGTEFWNSSLYLGWLNSIRTLNPPEERSSLPAFMQTAAWWQEKMNTQLASWAQLRHDNILYGKQSYSGGVTCSYPYVYVEPVPEFYLAVKTLAENWINVLKELNMGDNYTEKYLNELKAYSDTLLTISQKELNKEALSEQEIIFLKGTLVSVSSECGSLPYDGWYSRLYFNPKWIPNDMGTVNRIVADVHTAPTDASGNPVGWVLHAGTGYLNMGVFVAPDNAGRNIAYAGPVMSYYEYTTNGFNRLDDTEWTELLDGGNPPASPVFTNIYLANKSGNSSGSAISISTAVEKDKNPLPLPVNHLTAVNYPNPFNPSTVICFSIPYSLRNKPAELIIYDMQGKEVRHLLKENLQEGNYLIRWDSKADNGIGISSGIYLYRLSAGTESVSGKMMFIK